MKLITFISTGIFIVVAGLLLKKESEPQPSLYETKWHLKKIQGDTGMQDVNTRAFIQFNEEKKSAGGNGSCNSFGSTAVVNGKTVSFSNIFSTKMYCEGVQQTEDLFFNNLGKVTRYEIRGNNLSLYSEDSLLLEFSADNK